MGTLVFSIGAVVVWREEARPDPFSGPFSDEQLEQMRAARHKEILDWLVRRVSVSEVESMIRGFGDSPQYIRDFATENLTEEDELWLYDNGEEAWMNLGGEWGLAVTRRGELRAFLMIENN